MFTDSKYALRMLMKSPMLYEVSALDPIAFTIAPLVLALPSVIATWLPARRATRTNPMAAFRNE